MTDVDRSTSTPTCPHCGDVAPYGDARLTWLSAHIDSRLHRARYRPRPHLHYLSYVARHKWFVFRAGLKTQAPLWRLLIHDWSKFSPAEWGPYVRTFYAKDRAREGEFDAAWLHHQHRNSHHWQHWLLQEDDGDLKTLRMPYKLVRGDGGRLDGRRTRDHRQVGRGLLVRGERAQDQAASRRSLPGRVPHLRGAVVVLSHSSTGAMMVPVGSPYRNVDCPNCGRHRVQGDEYPPDDGVCEKCGWDVDAGEYAVITRGAACVVCRSEDVDLLTGRCRDEHWHGFGSAG